jgi:hypothetical protein
MSVDRRAGEAHYKTGGMEPIEFIEANKMGFSEGCIVKYAQRHRNKPFEEAVKDLYDIAIYAYLILKHQYDRGPLVDGRFVPTLKNTGQPVPAMPPAPKPPSYNDEPFVATGFDGNAPTTEQWAALHTMLNAGGSNRLVANRELLGQAMTEILSLRKSNDSLHNEIQQLRKLTNHP